MPAVVVPVVSRSVASMPLSLYLSSPVQNWLSRPGSTETLAVSGMAMFSAPAP
jgi:hypothetical protein